MSSALILHAHQDDLTLWCSFSALKHENVTAWTMLDSYIQPARGHAFCNVQTRRVEDLNAADILGVDLQFGGFHDDTPDWDGMREFLLALRTHRQYDHVYIPAVEEGGHDHHNMLGAIAGEIWPNATRVLSYTKRGKSRNGTEVKPTGAMILKKLKALACYKTQIEIEALGCWPHFMDLREFVL